MQYLKRNIHAAKKIVLAAGSRALRDLFEESSESLDAAYFVQLAHCIEHGGLVVVVPETMSVRATQTLSTEGSKRRGTKAHSGNH